MLSVAVVGLAGIIALAVAPLQGSWVLAAVGALGTALAGAVSDAVREVVSTRLQQPFAPARSPSPDSRPWNVPTKNQDFTGRQAQLDRIRATAGNASSRSPIGVTVISGMAGVGKTQLAIEFAHRSAEDFDIVWWVDAEQPSLVGEQFHLLAVELKLVDDGASGKAAAAAVKQHLRGHPRWLLIFDNAEPTQDVQEWLPAIPTARTSRHGTRRHVLVTTRGRNWLPDADKVNLDVFTEAESLGLLRRTLGEGYDAESLSRLSRAVDRLPLALVQAAGYIEQYSTGVDWYLEELRKSAGDVLGEAGPHRYGPSSFTGVVELTAARLAREDPIAADMAGMCALLAPFPIPRHLLLHDLADAPPDKASPWDSPQHGPAALARLKSLARLEQLGLVRTVHTAVQMHRLTQAVLRERLTGQDRQRLTERVEAMLVASQPGDPAHPENFLRWPALLPHILQMQPAENPNHGIRSLACQATWYLLTRGDIHAGLDLARKLFDRWHAALGPDDEHTLWAANSVGRGHYELGEYERARQVHADTLARRTAVLGPDDQQTLITANNLAMDLYRLQRFEEARDLDRETLTHRTRTLGPDHVHTLVSANNLARDLRATGQVAEAEALDLQTLAERRRVLKDADHPHILDSEDGLARNLFALRRFDEAARRDADTLARFREVLGKDHTRTLESACNLGRDLYQLGRLHEARRLDQDTLTRRRRVFGEDHPFTRESANNVALDDEALRAMSARRRVLDRLWSGTRSPLTGKLTCAQTRKGTP